MLSPSMAKQEAGDERCDDRTRQLFRDEVHQQHRRGAHQRDHETPRRAVAGAEQPHSQRDDPLAQRRMHHEAAGPGERARTAGHERLVRAVAPGSLVAERPQRPGVFDVVRLIERERLRGGEVRQAQHGCESGDHQRRQPADDAVPLRIKQHPVAQAPPERQALLGRREQRCGRRHGISLRRAPKLKRVIILAATPIGNLGDASRRLVEVLENAEPRRRRGHPHDAASAAGAEDREPSAADRPARPQREAQGR